MRGKLWLAVALSPVLMASTCTEQVHVRVEPGRAPADPPAFRFAYRGEVLTALDAFRVEDCESRLLWQIRGDESTRTVIEPIRITYGQVPREYRETKPATPLQPGGCYQAGGVAVEQPRGAATFGGERFRLLPNGQLVVGWAGGLTSRSRAFPEINRAAVGCARGYRRARTRADSAAVDAREHPVLDARPTCAWLTTHWPDLTEAPASTERAALALLALAIVTVAYDFLLDAIPGAPD